MFRKHCINLTSLFAQLFGKGQYCGFNRCDSRVKMHNRSYVALCDLLFLVRFAQKSKRYTVGAQGWFNNIWYVLCICIGVKIFKGLSAAFHVSAQIVVSSVGNAPQFAPFLERESEFDVCCGFRVECKFLRIVVTVS